MEYLEFLRSKQWRYEPSGFEPRPVNNAMFPFQADITSWSIRKGRSAIFADCGLGKTLMELEFGQQVVEQTNRPVLIAAPLSVSQQTKREGLKFGYDVNICRTQDDVITGINITNYEMLEHFDPSAFSGIIPDESSILKSFNSKTRLMITSMFAQTPYKLPCSATPAPNDFMELGNHSEFLGVMSRTEMLATYFVHDGSDTAKWRLKGHAENKFWEWLASWAVVIKSPADLGYPGDGYELPPLNIQTIFVESPQSEESLFIETAQTLAERRAARKESIEKRVSAAADIVNSSNEQWAVWCDYNDESAALAKAIAGAVEVKGSDKPEHKEESAVSFASGNIKALVSKPSIYGFGMNWQNCNNVIFCGLSDSYEQFYQAVRRFWRYGQSKPVNVHVIISEREESVLQNIMRKQADADRMSENMIRLTAEITKAEIRKTSRVVEDYKPRHDMILPSWILEAG